MHPSLLQSASMDILYFAHFDVVRSSINRLCENYSNAYEIRSNDPLTNLISLQVLGDTSKDGRQINIVDIAMNPVSKSRTGVSFHFRQHGDCHGNIIECYDGIEKLTNLLNETICVVNGEVLEKVNGQLDFEREKERRNARIVWIIAGLILLFIIYKIIEVRMR